MNAAISTSSVFIVGATTEDDIPGDPRFYMDRQILGILAPVGIANATATPLEGTLTIDAGVRRLPWVALADVSPALRAALLASEDKRFYQHAGVDWDWEMPAVTAGLNRSV